MPIAIRFESPDARSWLLLDEHRDLSACVGLKREGMVKGLTSVDDIC
jgi:hypothetical protein